MTKHDKNDNVGSGRGESNAVGQDIDIPTELCNLFTCFFMLNSSERAPDFVSLSRGAALAWADRHVR